jgi:hypothetical protein
MSTETSRPSRVFAVVESVILGVCVMLITWTAQTVIVQGKVMASQGTSIEANENRLTSIEDRGSRSLESHTRLDDNRDSNMSERVMKIEAAILALQGMAGEIKAIGVKLEALHEGQVRIEKQINKNP